jgi:Domain of unknown function (DUF222)
VSAAAAPSSAREALAMVRAGLGYLAAADPAEMPGEVQAECLRGLEQADAVATAARAWILGAFAASQGPAADADYSPRAWLVHKTGVTRGAAAGHVGWARRAVAHPQVAVALAEGTVLSESVARKLCGWTDRLPEGCRQAADEILVAAARAGADERDLAGLAAEIRARAPHEEEDGKGFEDRCLRLETTFDGAGVIRGDLTPECAAVLGAVLDALAVPAGAEDTRSREQRYHDALEEAARRLVAGGLLPGRAGQPVKGWVHVSLAELRARDQDSTLEDEWVTVMRARWAAHRAAASVAGGDGAAWLDGAAARALACDAMLTPVVTGEVDPGVLEDLVRLCVQLAGHGHCGPQADHGTDRDRDGDGDSDSDGDGPRPPTPRGRDALEQAIIGKAIDLVSGPGGLASFLRRHQLDGRLAGPSLPLDVGASASIPAAIRAAVILRDQHCQWPGGCGQPAAGCQVHHLRHQANGGPTSVEGCALYCTFHHQVAIHRWGWTIQRHPDGTSTAYSPDGTKILHSHGPPPRPG